MSLNERTRINMCAAHKENIEDMTTMSIESLVTFGPTHAHLMDEALKRFWKNGVVGGNETDRSALNQYSECFTNPLFTESSYLRNQFVVHHTANPLKSFYLAEAFIPVRHTGQGEHYADTVNSQSHVW